jgi:hypothetical protein
MPSLGDNPFELRPQVHPFAARHRHDQRGPWFGLLERVGQEGPEFRTDRYDADGVVTTVMLGLL